MDLTGKKILVTGAGGFLGGHVLAALRSRGVENALIIAPTREEYDLRNEADCARLAHGVDVVLHLAGVTGNTEFHKREPARIYFDNLVMGAHMMEAARRAGVQKFIAIGSAAEYPEDAPLPYRESDLWNGYPEEKHAPYAIAKRMLWVQAWAYYQQYKFVAAHLVMTNMYGPGESADNVTSALIKRIIEAKRSNSPVIEMSGSGDATRDFIYVKDAAEAILLAAEKCESPDPVNIASGQEIPIKKIAELARTLMGFPGTIRFNASSGGVSRRVLDVTRAHSVLGFEAKTDFETGFRETIEDFSRRIAGDVRIG